MSAKARILGTLGSIFFGLIASLATAQPRDEYGEMRQTVARISFLSGPVSFSRGDDPEDWQPADRNVPMTVPTAVSAAGDAGVSLTSCSLAMPKSRIVMWSSSPMKRFAGFTSR